MVFGGGAVWVGGLNGVSKVKPLTGVEFASARPFGEILGVAYGDGSVWLASDAETEVVRLHPTSLAVEARIATGGAGLEAVFHDGLLWVVVAKPE